MSKDIWHNKKEKPTKKLHCNRIIITKWGSCLDEIDIDNGATIETDWAFLDDLLALEAELDRTRKALDVAVDALEDMNEIIKDYEYGNGLYYALDGHDTMLVVEAVEKALKLINQKD